MPYSLASQRRTSSSQRGGAFDPAAPCRLKVWASIADSFFAATISASNWSKGGSGDSVTPMTSPWQVHEEGGGLLQKSQQDRRGFLTDREQFAQFLLSQRQLGFLVFLGLAQLSQL